MTAALALVDISKRFGRTQALAQARLLVRSGSVHALLGQNGAGKTTLMRIAFGMVQPDSGRVEIAGESVALRSPADAIRRGVAMVHQHFTLVPAMTVAENIALGGRGLYDATQTRRRVREVATSMALAMDPDMRAGALTVGDQQRVEIVKALARDARTLILDEPTAALAPAEAVELLDWLRRFASDGGAVVLITHKLREALTIADEITVLRDGRTVLERVAAETDESVLARAMLGDAASALRGPELPERPRSERIAAPTVLGARQVSVRDTRDFVRVRDVTLDVAAGEILGVAGIEGAGQRELLRALAGRVRPSAGVIIRPPLVGFIPDDRQREALVLDFTLAENLALSGAGARRGRISWRALEHRTRALIEEFAIRAEAPGASARSLSGGNQQRFVLARELAERPPALVAENPTRGLDLQATEAVQRRLLDARDAGCAVVLHSSDLDEVLRLADRIVVLHNGRARSVARDRDAVGRALLGLP